VPKSDACAGKWARFDSDHDGFGRAIETVLESVNTIFSEDGSNPLTSDCPNLDRSYAGNDPSKKSVQSAAGIAVVTSPIVMATTAAFLAVALRLLMMDMVSNRIGKVLRTWEWRWHDARELGQQKRDH
jgi:hypothetical protein